MWQSLLRFWVQQQVRQSAAEALKAATGQRAPVEGPPLSCDVGVVFALGIEAGGLEDLLEGAVVTQAGTVKLHEGDLRGRRVVVAESGIGQQSAAAATQTLIAGHRPALVISAGFAGGLDRRLMRGDIVLANAVIHADGRRLAIDVKLEPGKRLHVGPCTTTDQVVWSAAEKEALGKRSQALAVDMESWAVGEVCRQAKTRFLAVRIVSDGMDDELPPDVEALARQKSRAGRLGAAAGAIFRRPSSIKDMLRLKEDALLFSDRLARFLAGMIEQMAPRREERSSEE